MQGVGFRPFIYNLAKQHGISGTVSNTSYLAIPFNAPNAAGAQVVANFLQSPEAQAVKQDPDVLGDLTVLELERLPADMRARFRTGSGPATLPPQALSDAALPEAHSSWILPLQDGWRRRVAGQ